MGASIENHILTITDPVIQLDELKSPSLNEENPDKSDAKTSEGLRKLISINNVAFTEESIIYFNLNCKGKIPTIDVKIADLESRFSVDSIPRDGDVLSLRIGHLEKSSYKDIRIDFDITSLDASNQDYNVAGNSYSFTGRMKIPGLYSDECKSYGSGTSIEHVEAIANDLKLGLATNIDTTDDKMTLILPNSTRQVAINDLVNHSYIDEDSFQTYAIDPYYYLNYVNLNSLINSEESFTDIILGLNAQYNDQHRLGAEIDTAINQIPEKLVLNNHKLNLGTNLFIESHAIINASASVVKKHGYKRTIQFYENDSDEGLVSHDIEPLASKNLRDIEEPMKGRRGEENYKSQVKTKYLGRKNADADTSHTHLNYEFAEIHNAQNFAEAKKMMLEVTLSSLNPAIHLFQKIPIVIYIQETTRVGMDRNLKKDLQKKGFPVNDEDGFIDNEEKITYASRLVPDVFLSAYYVVIGIEYKYSQGEENISQILTLLRREWPSRLNNLTQKTLSSPVPKPDAPPPPPPVAPPAPPPEPPPPPPPPPKEPVLSISDNYFKYESGLGSWYDLNPSLLWLADDISLVTEAPKIKVKFTGPLEKEYDATVYLDKRPVTPEGFVPKNYNFTFSVPKGTWKDKEGAHTIKITLTYKEQVVEKEFKWEWRPWKTGDILDQSRYKTSGTKKTFRWEASFGPTFGLFLGKYTLAVDAKKGDSNPPMNGKIENEDLELLLKEVDRAQHDESMNDPDKG